MLYGYLSPSVLDPRATKCIMEMLLSSMTGTSYNDKKRCREIIVWALESHIMRSLLFYGGKFDPGFVLPPGSDPDPKLASIGGSESMIYSQAVQQMLLDDILHIMLTQEMPMKTKMPSFIKLIREEGLYLEALESALSRVETAAQVLKEELKLLKER